MSIRLKSYLKRNRFGIYYFRRVIPRDLRKYFAFRQVSRSTLTHDPREARCLALRFGASIDLLFSKVRKMTKTPDPDDIESESLMQEMIVELDFDLDGTIKSVKTDLKPEEADIAERLIPSLIRAAQQGGVAKPVVGARLFDEFDKYINEQARVAEWRPQTVQDVRGDFDQFKVILGDMSVASINHDTLNALRDTLLRLPANINKNSETRGKSIPEILALGFPPQSALTVKKKWGRLITFFNWLEGKGLISRNYAQGKKPKAKAQSYEKFTRADLSALFESPDYREGAFDEAFKYWLPTIGIFTGARQEEIAQLHLADFKLDAATGFHYAEITDITDDDGGAKESKKLKNSSSARECPIHPALIDAGLLIYIDDLKLRGYDRLFPELTLDGVGKVGPRASEWFTEYRRSRNVGAIKGRSRKVFHSFRHTMNATLQKAGVSSEVREALCGHAPQGTNSRVYGGKLPMPILMDALKQLKYEIEFTAYRSLSSHEEARKRARQRAEG